jgi:hypothetical protein
MSHHFDRPTAREDPRINLCDFYLFRGIPGTVAMALTVNPDAGAGGLDTFREEGLYAFRFDLNDDAREEVTFKIRFGEVMHAAGEQRLGGFHQIRPASLLQQNGWIHAKGSTWRLKFQDPSGPKTRADLIMGEYPHFNEYP